MHPAIVYIQNGKGEANKDPIKTQLSFTPELNTTIYYKGIKATVIKVTIDIGPALPAIIIHAQII